MKLMAVTYVHDILHEIYPYPEGTLSPFPRVQWQGRETDRSLSSGGDVVKVWSFTATDSN